MIFSDSNFLFNLPMIDAIFTTTFSDVCFGELSPEIQISKYLYVMLFLKTFKVLLQKVIWFIDLFESISVIISCSCFFHADDYCLVSINFYVISFKKFLIFIQNSDVFFSIVA